ncbi:MAG TPA: glycosyltransferase family 39 protein [Candidatus Acidoferrum sp.]|nr:glycosyltransferase family 39 protein [Candidatus Acidoferrum sp.]
MTASVRLRSWPSLVILVLLWLAVYVPGLVTPPLQDDVDASHADAGQEILTRHDWVTLHENGIRYLEKAPLPYWGMAVGMKLFGPDAWSARLFLHLSVLANAFLLYFFGRRFLTERAGFWAAVVFLACCGPYLFTRILIPDVTVGLWIGLILYLFLDGWQSEKPTLLSCWSIAALIALNVLTKSLIGIVFPCAIIFLFLLLARDLRHLLKMHLVSSALVFLLVAVPWHILAALRNPPAGESKGFLWFYFVNEQFLRYLNKRYPHDYNTVPLLLFYGLLLLWFLPWSSFLPQALAQVSLRLPRVAGVRRSPRAVLLLLFCWPAIILLFFSFSTRQEYYVAPGLPGLALIIGYWLARESEAPVSSPIARAGRRSALVLLVTGLVIAAITGFLALTTRTPAPGSDIFDALNQNPNVYTLSLGHFLDLTSNAMAFFRGPLIGTALAFTIAPLLNWFLRRRGQRAAANWALVAMMMVFIECAHIALGVFYPILGSKQFAVAIQQRLQPGELIVCDGEYANASSVRFYTGQQLLILNGRINGLWYGSLFPDSPDIFLDDARFRKLWSGANRVYLVTGDLKKRDSIAAVAPAYLLTKAGGRYVFSNRP